MRSIKRILQCGLVLVAIVWIAFSSTAQNFDAAGMPPDVARLYGHLIGKTVLGPARLPRIELPAPEVAAASPALERSNAIAGIEAALAEADVDVIHDGDLFVWIVPAGLSNSPVMREIVRIPKPVRNEAATAQPHLDAGVVDFRNLPIDQFLAVWAGLSGRTVLRPALLPVPGISLVMESDMTRDELLYAFRIVLALNGLVAVEDGAKFYQVLPLALASRVTARAPVPASGDDLIEVSKVPVFGGRAALSPPPQPVPAPYADNLLAYFADLSGFKMVASETLGKFPVRFEVRNPLTRAELYYAVETTFALNDLSIERDAEGSVRLTRKVQGR